MASSDNVIIGSYNCRGYNDYKTEFVRSLMLKVDILFMQEHWLTDNQTCVLSNIGSSFLCHAISGFDNTAFHMTTLTWRILLPR
jgi:hypothetical protein